MNLNWKHYAGAVGLLVVGYLIATWYPQPGATLRAKLGM